MASGRCASVFFAFPPPAFFSSCNRMNPVIVLTRWMQIKIKYELISLFFLFKFLREGKQIALLLDELTLD